jgi:hypothetical protein
VRVWAQVGSILVAVNPCKAQPTQDVQQYAAAVSTPHLNSMLLSLV